MNILFLFISLNNLEEPGVFSDLIREFARQGHKVKVATPLQDSKGREGVRLEAGIEVLRFKTDQLTKNKSTIRKGIAYLKLIYQYPHAIKKYFGKEEFDLIVSHSLPPELGIIIPGLKRYYQAKFYLMLCEFIWQDAVSLGLLKKSNPICKYYNWLEDRIIRCADYIGCPSRGNIDFALRYHPWAKSKDFRVLYYCEYPIRLGEMPADFRKRFKWGSKFIAIYGGSINIAQKIENIVNLAESCLSYKDIVFVIVGKGSHFEKVRDDAEKRGVNNIQFLDYMPQDDYLQLLKACDVGLVSLNEKLMMPNIPSKTLILFNLSKPIVAAIDHSTDYGVFLELAHAGLWSYSGDTEAFRNNLLQLYKSPELAKEMGENGNLFYRKNMTPDKAYQTIIDQIKVL